MEKYTFKVYPAGHGRDVYRVIEVSGENTLDDLCEYILECFDFVHEHLYEFCMDNKLYSECSYQYDPDDGGPSTDIAIKNIGLIKGQNFLLHYDYGDDWMFTIHVQKIDEADKMFNMKMITSKGEINQYPDYDEWDDEYDEEEGI